jgi:hypothetical protein
MKIGRGSRGTRRKPAPAPLCPPQIPHAYTRSWGFLAWLTFQYWRWRRYMPLKRRTLSELHIVTTQNTVLFRVITMRTSKQTNFEYVQNTTLTCWIYKLWIANQFSIISKVTDLQGKKCTEHNTCASCFSTTSIPHNFSSDKYLRSHAQQKKIVRYVCPILTKTGMCRPKGNKKKVKLSLQQDVEAHRVVRCRGFYIF